LAAAQKISVVIIESDRKCLFILPVGSCHREPDSILHAAASIKKLVVQVEVPAGLPVIPLLSPPASGRHLLREASSI
jgi:hypothetical protein